jgi:4-diphosphocytidyl-2-C-methyl-D-erythritol kinase
MRRIASLPMLSFPNCKINIGLHVTEKRSDGFHNIETILFPVEWQDILEIVPDEKTSGEVDFKCTGVRVFGTREKNLCIKAYNLLAQHYTLPVVKMYLHKVIPVGAGLGGGSADAAHTIILLNKIFKLNISEKDQENFATQLGSDCSFFVRNKQVIATGKGEIFEPIKIKSKNIFCVIVKPRIHVSTSEAYSWIKPKKRKTSLSDLIQLPLSEWQNNIENDFEKVVAEKYPVIKNIKTRLYKLGAVYASMSGSGSAVYGLFNEEKHLDTYFRSSTVWSGMLSG